MLLFGSLIHTPSQGKIELRSRSLVAINETGQIENIFSEVSPPFEAIREQLSPKFCSLPVFVLSNTQFILPGFIDTHVHAAQYTYTGTGTDVPLMQWLNKYAFPAELRLADTTLANQVYKLLISRLLRNGTTTALYFGTIHLQTNKVLADVAEELGQRALVGKVCMDRNSHPSYQETTEDSLRDTESFIRYVIDKKNELLTPVITPRFIPTCTLELMRGLGDLAKRYQLPIQSHISESEDEIEFVRQLHPEGGSDSQIFASCSLLTPRTVMAHGVHLSSDDVKILISNSSSISHCPLSNFFFADGVFPLKQQLRNGLKVGLGTDVAGGYSPSILSSMRNAVIASKSLSVTNKKQSNEKEVGSDEIDWKMALWLATMGGAQALSLDKVIGSFAPGKQFDAVLISCSPPPTSSPSTLPYQVVDQDKFFSSLEVEEKTGRRETKWTIEMNSSYQPFDLFDWEDQLAWLEKFINLGDERNISAVWVKGRKVV